MMRVEGGDETNASNDDCRARFVGEAMCPHGSADGARRFLASSSVGPSIAVTSCGRCDLVSCVIRLQYTTCAVCGSTEDRQIELV